jgi:putative hydrolase of the HAD superfamily
MPMIGPEIRAVFFDAVGTLLMPAVPVWTTYAECARRHGMNVSEDDVSARFVAAFMRQEKRDLQDGWRTDEAREQARWRAIVAEVFPGADADACFAELWQWFSTAVAWAVNPDAPAVLAALADRGLVVGIASNFDSRLNGLLASMPELSALRDRSVVSSSVGWRKPAREFFAALVRAAGSAPERILYVGDDLRNDVHGATAAGLRAVLYDPEIRPNSGDRIHSLRDLLRDTGVSS